MHTQVPPDTNDQALIMLLLEVNRTGLDLIMVRDQTKPHPLYWKFPGGKIKLREHPLAAAIRECHEETGIDLTTHKTIVRIGDSCHRESRQQGQRYATYHVHMFGVVLDQEPTGQLTRPYDTYTHGKHCVTRIPVEMFRTRAHDILRFHLDLVQELDPVTYALLLRT